MNEKKGDGAQSLLALTTEVKPIEGTTSGTRGL